MERADRRPLRKTWREPSGRDCRGHGQFSGVRKPSGPGWNTHHDRTGREWSGSLYQHQADIDSGCLGTSNRVGEPVCPTAVGKRKRWIEMMESLEEARRKAEAVKDTEQELEGLIPIKMTVSPNLGIVYSLRFSTDEMKVLRDAAKNRGMKLSEFIREVSMDAASQ